jgi:hypothetical protein
MLAVLALPLAARADAVDFQLVNKVLAGGKERPSLMVAANQFADLVEIVLRREDGKRFEHRVKRLAAGATRRFPIEIAPGPARHYTCALSVTVGGEKRTVDFEFDAELVAPAQLGYQRADVDLDARTMTVTSSRKTARVEVDVVSDAGEELGHTEIPFEEAPPGTPLAIRWNQAEGTVLKITVKVFDTDNFYNGIELYPWHLEIPHEEVSFASNSAEIAKAEQHKLDKSLGLVVDAVERYGRWAEIKLYIAGHTDTVGDARSNRALSLERARSISHYFLKKGLRVAIFYEGFGEQVLKVGTPDETDEPRNRRADYFVAVEPPHIPGGSAHWKRLR